MSKFFKIFFCISMLFGTISAMAQEQPQQKSPEEIAAIEIEHWESELNLNQTQIFYLDSILNHNYKAMFEEIEKMRGMGLQNPETFRTIQGKWVEKNVVALKGILDEQQYITYLKGIGRGKEYKRGKDGLYYKKEELARQKAEAKAKK